jgi:hypothetical protein
VAAQCWWSRGRSKGEQQKGRARFGFIGTQDSVEVKRRESSRVARLRSAGGAGVSSGHAWRPFGLSGATWQGEGRTAEAARAVGGGWGDAWTGGAALQKLGKRPAAAVTRARRGTEEIGDPRKTMEDLNANSEKSKDLSIKHR